MNTNINRLKTLNTKVTIQGINFNQLKREDIFSWFELFSFKRYGVRYYVDPSKRDDPRYPAKEDGSPVDWYTHLSVPSQYYNKTCVIIDKEMYDKIKEAFLKNL